MNRAAEATFWQAVGLLVGMAGCCVLGYVTYRFGLVSISPKAMEMGLAASFLILTGIACFISGRALHVEETELNPREAFLWKALAIICCVSGAVVVVFTFTQHAMIDMDRLAMGLAGSFALMTGVICLMGQRVMSHMHDMVKKPDGVKAANA